MVTLRETVEKEGKGEAFGVAWDEADDRTRSAMLVRYLYREARAAIHSNDLALKEKALAYITMFEAESMRLAEMAVDCPDTALVLLVHHNVASIMGLAGRKAEQNKLNHMLWSQIEKLDPEEQVDPDIRFVRSKIFFGLLENDRDFAQSISLDLWATYVADLEADRYPDFPGRALRLAREYMKAGKLQKAIALLVQAVACNFGKEDQIRDALAYRTELEKMLPPEPEEG